MDLAKAVKSKETIVVVGNENEYATKVALSGEAVKFCTQKSQLGTGDAVKVALEGFKIKSKYTLILYGDTPFIKNKTIKKNDIKSREGF